MTDTTSTEHKFAVVLNRTIEPGTALNACAHLTACLVARASDDDRQHMAFVDYLDGSDGAHPVSALPLIILAAKNSNQIRTARNNAADAGLLYVDFTESMTKDTYVEQMQRTRALPEADLDYWGLALFGPKTVIDPITKRFSLWRA
jgi:hypothetical protein